ncbi:MAG: hypothetical protein ACYC4S_09635 [Rhodoferax sp.]
MVDLNYSTPAHGPLFATDAERVEAMRRCVGHSAHSHRMHTVDFKFFDAVVRLGSIIGVFTALALVERAPHSAWWLLLGVLALLVLNIAFNATDKALRHARHEGALREMLADLDTNGSPIDADELTRYESRATQLISRD